MVRIRRQRGLLLALLLLAGGPGAPAGERFAARVVGVTDGDTLTVLRAGRRETVRLRGIDAPERGQPYGTRAKQYLSALASGQVVTVESAGRDRYGRLLADVILPDGRRVNQELVRAGYAWWFRRYSADATLAGLEAEARAARRGLWADPHPVPPWAYRQRRARAAQVSTRTASEPSTGHPHWWSMSGRRSRMPQRGGRRRRGSSGARARSRLVRLGAVSGPERVHRDDPDFRLVAARRRDPVERFPWHAIARRGTAVVRSERAPGVVRRQAGGAPGRPSPRRRGQRVPDGLEG